MAEAKLFAFDGNGSSTAELDARLFDSEINVDLMHRAVRVLLMNRRRGTASTKTRGEVRGGGRKPWRQKGTGRARAGSRRSPLWVGGGITFGPRPRNYDLKLTKKMRRRALTSALSDRAQEDRVILLDRVSFEEPKTKAAIALIGRLEIDGTALFVVGRDEFSPATTKSFRNLPGISCVVSDGLNAYDVLRHETLVVTQTAVAELGERV
ncbi:MAG: 50S ribosomal protein L4 [Candidatus Bipolaricaulota bacterium]|nr:MAG: 50S ribosomal protein L4 [Candidatus Bipolaricaulota bacterium]